MARKPKPWFRKDRNQWYIQHRGRQVPLGADKEQAEKKWHSILALSESDTAGDDNPYKVVAEQFMDWISRTKKPKTYKVYRLWLETFSKEHGDVLVKNLKPHHVENVMKGFEHWSKSTQRSFLVCINTSLNWGVKKGYLSRNPLSKKLDIPPVVSRGGDTLISPGDYQHMLDHATPQLRDFLIAARNTGTRPHVIASITGEHFDEANECWIVEEHKTDGTGDKLIVHLNDVALNLTKRLVEKYPEGPLFRNGRGNAWTDTALGKGMAGLRRTLTKAGVKLSGRGIMYGLRHSFATDLLEAKVPEAHVASLMGHKSTVMLAKHYSHLGAKARSLKEHLKYLAPVKGEVSPTGGAGTPDRLGEPVGGATGTQPEVPAVSA